MYNKNLKVNHYVNMVKMVFNGMYPNKEMMEMKITNVVAKELISEKEGDILKELLDRKERGELDMKEINNYI